MKRTNAKMLIEKLVKIFTYFGLPQTIVSDNGPPFGSREFKKFAEKHNIKLMKSPPYHPQSNGLAERNVQTVKKILYKSILDTELKHLDIQQRIVKFLMHNRNTPTMNSSETPSQLILSYKPRILLDSVNKKVRFNLENNKEIEFVKNKNVYNKNNVRKTGNGENKILYKNFKKGEKVMFLNHIKNYLKWIPAVILKKISPLTYLIKIHNIVRYCHQNVLRKSNLHDKFHPSRKMIDVNRECELDNSVTFEDTKIDKNIEHDNNFLNSDSETLSPRKSERTRRVPDRWKYE